MRQLLLIAAALALLTTTAHAGKTMQTYTLHQGKYWQTFATINNGGDEDDAGPQCGMYTGGDVSRFYIKWTPRYGTRVQLWKRNWRLAKGADVPFKIDFFDDAKPDDNQTLNMPGGWAVPSDASGTSVFANVDKDDEAKLLATFGDADRITVHFPEGDEPSWNVKTEGTRRAASEFTKCIATVQQATATATQPVTPKATQPVVPSQPALVQPKPTTSEMLFVIPRDVSGGHMNVRNGPGSNHGLLGAIPAGQTVRASRCVRRDDGIAGADWCLVTWNGLTGWVSQVGLMPVSPQPTQPVASSAASKGDGGI